MLNSFETALNSGSLDDVDSVLDDIDQFSDGMSAERSDIGARYNRLELINTRLSAQEETATKVLSDNEDVELEEIITEFIAQRKRAQGYSGCKCANCSAYIDRLFKVSGSQEFAFFIV